MNYTVEIDPGAELDLLEAAAWYEMQSEGLGAEFWRQVTTQNERLSRYPLINAIDYEDVRRAFLGKFPYSLHFRIEDDCVRVLACIHHSRDPQRWPGA